MKEKVIIQRIDITKKSELKTFQFKMPPDAKRIIGFETSPIDVDMFGSPFFALPLGLYDFKTTFLLGEVRIQSYEKANLFYSSHVFLSDQNLGWGDFSQTLSWQNALWSFGYKRQEDIVGINECAPVVQGNYRDKLGEFIGSDFPYSLNIYMWYETNEK